MYVFEAVASGEAGDLLFWSGHFRGCFIVRLACSYIDRMSVESSQPILDLLFSELWGRFTLKSRILNGLEARWT